MHLTLRYTMTQIDGNGHNLEGKLRGRNGKDILKSQGERRVAEFLDNYGIRYIYEKPVAILDGNKTKIWHPDFYLPDFGVYVEFYGLAGQPDYDRGIQRKTSLYSANGIDVVGVYPSHFKYDWQTHFKHELRNIENYRRNALPRTYSSKVIQGQQRNYSTQTLSNRTGHAAYRRQGYR